MLSIHLLRVAQLFIGTRRDGSSRKHASVATSNECHYLAVERAGNAHVQILLGEARERFRKINAGERTPEATEEIIVAVVVHLGTNDALPFGEERANIGQKHDK
jgi:hypothetical protein